MARPAYTEYGLGLLWDIDLFDKTNLVLGGRYDIIKTKNEEFAGTFNTADRHGREPRRVPRGRQQRRGDRPGSLVQREPLVQVAVESAALRTYAAEQRAARRQQQPHRQQRRHRWRRSARRSSRKLGIKASFFNNRLFVSTASFRAEPAGGQRRATIRAC